MLNFIYDHIDPIEGPKSNLSDVFPNRFRKNSSEPAWSFIDKNLISIKPSFFGSKDTGWFYPIDIYIPTFYLSEILTSYNEQEHFFYYLSPNVQKGLKEEKGWILINTFEPVGKIVFDMLKEKINQKSDIPYNRFIFVTPPNFNHPNFPTLPTSPFFDMKIELNLSLKNKPNIDKRIFCCFNKNFHKSYLRYIILGLLEKYELLDKGYISAKDRGKITQPFKRFKSFTYDLNFTNDDAIFDTLDANILENVEINFVIESMMETNKSKDIYELDTYPTQSEKTYRSFLAKKPFLVMAYPEHLQKLREMGFKTFNDIFDETYDHEKNDMKRLALVINELRKYCSLSKEVRLKLLEKVNHILEHNYKVANSFISSDFLYNKLYNIQSSNMLGQ